TCGTLVRRRLHADAVLIAGRRVATGVRGAAGTDAELAEDDAAPVATVSREASFRARGIRRIGEVRAQIRPRSPRPARIADLARVARVQGAVRVSGATDDTSIVAVSEQTRAVRAAAPACTAVVVVEAEVDARLVCRATRSAGRATLARADAGLT